MKDLSLQQPYKFQVNLRPVKHAYFIRSDDWNALEEVVQLSCTQWGGIQNLIIPVNPDKSIVFAFEEFLKLHDADYFINYTNWALPENLDGDNDLHTYLTQLFPHRKISIQSGSHYPKFNITAHAIDVLGTEDDQNNPYITLLSIPNRLNNSKLIADFDCEHISSVIYGRIYQNQEGIYKKSFELVEKEIAIGSLEFWESQINNQLFGSIVNLTNSLVSAYQVLIEFMEAKFNVVVGDDINAICFYWNLRATEEATRFQSRDTNRRTILAPWKTLESNESLNNLISILEKYSDKSAVNSNLSILFTVCDEIARDNLANILLNNEKISLLADDEVPDFTDKSNKKSLVSNQKLTYLINVPDLPKSYHHKVGHQPATTVFLNAGKNEVLYVPPAGFQNKYGGSVAIDFVCNIWEKFPLKESVAKLIQKDGWFSHYGVTAIYGLSNRSHYLTFNIPSEWNALSAYFQGFNIKINPSPPHKYATGVLDIIGGWENMGILAKEIAYLLLDNLALKSTKKVAQRITNDLKANFVEDITIESISQYLRDFELTTELKGIPKSYRQLYNDNRLQKYRQELLSTLNDLSLLQVIKRGLYLECPNCGASDWHGIGNLAEMLTCSGCTYDFILPVEQNGSEISWQYRLNTLVNRAIDQDVLVPMLSVHHLIKNKEVACIIVGLELKKDSKILGDLDFVYVHKQKLYAGECKSGNEISQKDADMASLALELGIAQFYFCTASNNFSDNSLKLIEQTRGKAVQQGYQENCISILKRSDLLQ
ncbi:MAG: hypothetical protein OT477_17920 [Chloroflexi bacterium]|nr:hypothetical protein [Chloroflexota bacterium]